MIPPVMIHEFVREIEQRVWRKEYTTITFTLGMGSVTVTASKHDPKADPVKVESYSFASALQELNEALHESKKQTEA